MHFTYIIFNIILVELKYTTSIHTYLYDDNKNRKEQGKNRVIYCSLLYRQTTLGQDAKPLGRDANPLGRVRESSRRGRESVGKKRREQTVKITRTKINICKSLLCC